jgi:hypothetical protein
MSNSTKGFASMSFAKRRAAQQRGGTYAHTIGKAHEWTREEAVSAGKRSGRVRRARRRIGELLASLPTPWWHPADDSRLTRQELMGKLRISPLTLSMWEGELGLPVVLIAGRLKCYDIAQVSRWLAKMNEQ